MSFFFLNKRGLYIYIYIIFLLLGSSYSHRVWVFSSLHTRWASGWLADYMSGPVKKINRSNFLAIAVGSHRYSSFIRDVYQSQRDGGQPVREACLATAARPAAHVHPLQRRPAWICARPPHQATTSSTSAPASSRPRPPPPMAAASLSSSRQPWRACWPIIEDPDAAFIQWCIKSSFEISRSFYWIDLFVPNPS